MKTWLVLTMAIVAILTGGGCQTATKTVAVSNTTVDKAMKAWAVCVVNGDTTFAQEAAVKRAHKDYIAAEDMVLAAIANGNRLDLKTATAFLSQQQGALIALIEQFTHKEAK